MAPHALVAAAARAPHPAPVPPRGCTKNALCSRLPLARSSSSYCASRVQPPECSRAAVSSSSSSDEGPWWWSPGSGGILHRSWMVLVRSVLLLFITVLSTMAALHLRGRARFFVESRLLPPIASLLGAELGRQVELGRVRRLWPLGISLGPCYIGPHEHEFSCGEAPEVRIRIRPLRSLRRRRLTADVVLASPVVLVCQKEDWTWLGLPLPDKACKRSTDEQGDARATSRRIAKEAAGAKLAEERHRAARMSAQLGYTLPPVASSAPSAQTEAAELAQATRPGGFWSGLWSARLWVKDRSRQPSLAKMETILQRSASRASASLDPSRASARPLTSSSSGTPLTGPVDAQPGVDLDTVFFRDGSLLLLVYGDNEARLMDQVDGHVTFASTFQQIAIQLQGRPRAWKAVDGDDASLKLTVKVDLRNPKWHMKLSVRRLCAPLLERLLELPLDWHRGIVDGEVEAWMDMDDTFPNFGGTLNVRNLSFTIWEAPAAFKEVNGMLFLQGQRVFLHNTTGFFGAIPLNVSGDLDLNPEAGEFRLSCQVPGIEANALMETLKVRPPFSLAGAVKAVVYCRGPLDAPIFEGSGETLKNQLELIFAVPPSVASETIEKSLHRGALAAYDRVAFSSASASFTFNTKDCMANIYGIRASPIGGGEIRGAGDMWICPEAEADPTAIRIDCSGHVSADGIVTSYAGSRFPEFREMALFGLMQGEAKIRGSLLVPTFDIKWIIPDAKGPFNGARGEVSICDEAVCISSSAPAFDLSGRLFTSLGQALSKGARLENLDLDARLRGFDAMGLPGIAAVPALDTPQVKVSGRLKFQGRVSDATESGNPAVSGDISMWNLRLNQLLVASFLAGSVELSKSTAKVSATSRGKDHLLLQASPGGDNLEFSLQRGQLQIDLLYLPQSFAKWQVHGLVLDELELSSLRGLLEKVDVRLDLQKRRGHGCLSVRRPRFSGIHGESLDLSARWSGDVVTLEKSVFEQPNSRYELQGEYVFPGRERGKVPYRAEGGCLHKAMAGQLGNVMASLGRWRLRLEVPRAELLDMLPVARLLSRSSDPTIISRSKELFLQSVEKGAFIASTLKQEIEFIRSGTASSTMQDDSAGGSETAPLPGLADLNGRWHGALEASGGGNSDITANFDLHGESWTWGSYNIQKTVAAGSYSSADGLHFEKAFLQKDTATFHADGTMLGPSSNLHFALLNFPVQQLAPLMQALQSSSVEPLLSQQHRPLISGILHMEGDLRGDTCRPECDVQVRLLDGAVGGINLSRAEVSASVVASRQFIFEARLEPVAHAGYVHVKGSIPLSFDKSNTAEGEGDERRQVAASQAGPLYVDATIKDSGMLLLTAVTPSVNWLQGNADVRLQIRGTFKQPRIESSAVFQKVTISSPVLLRPISNLSGTVILKNNEMCVQNVEGRAGKRGRVLVNGRLPWKYCGSGESIELKADMLEVRARNAFSGQVDGHVWITGCLQEPEVTGSIQLSHGEAYLSQERSVKATSSTVSHLSEVEIISEDGSKPRLPVAIRLKGLKLQLGPELRMVYPLILNFAVLGELELHGYADTDQIKPRGVLTFENGDVNLFAAQVRLNKDYINQARFEPEQGLDPNLDLALVGVHWQLKVQGRAQNWQDSLVLSSARSGEQDALTRSEAARLFENQLVDSLLEGNGQLAFKKLAAATVETLMPKIETKGEFGQARWRLVYAPQIPNLLSLDPTTDPFKSLANLSFGTEVEVQLGRHLKASVVRQMKESEMATQWTLIYQLSSKLRLVFSSIPSVDKRLLFEYSASSKF